MKAIFLFVVSPLKEENIPPTAIKSSLTYVILRTVEAPAPDDGANVPSGVPSLFYQTFIKSKSI